MFSKNVLKVFVLFLAWVSLASCSSNPMKLTGTGRGEFVVNIWAYEPLPDDLKRKVDEAASCEKEKKCRSSQMVGALLRACEKDGVCKRSDVRVLVRTTFDISPVLNDTYSVLGKMMFVPLHGARVTMFASLHEKERDSSIVIPVGSYSLDSNEWTDARMNAHIVVRESKKGS